MEELKKLAMERQTPKLTLKAAAPVSKVCIAQALRGIAPAASCSLLGVSAWQGNAEMLNELYLCAMSQPMLYLTRLTLSRVCDVQSPNVCSNCCRLRACIVTLSCGHCALCVPSTVLASISRLCACACLAEASMETQPFEVSLLFLRLPTQGMGMGGSGGPQMLASRRLFPVCRWEGIY